MGVLVARSTHGCVMPKLMVHAVRPGCANGFDSRLNLDGTCFFKNERQLDQIAFCERAFQV